VRHLAENYDALWQRISQSPHCPIYHFVPGNWMNDPKLFFWNGAYHVFFQHNPNGPFWGTMHWGHTVSRDLVHWTPLPIALAPTPGGPDQDGCFTGSVVAVEDGFRIFYTGIPSLEPFCQTQCMASSEDLISWEKYPGNPLNISKPDGFGPCWRDPCVWKEGEDWFMLIGGEQWKGKGGVVFLYRSQNLIDWQYVHILHQGSREQVHSLSPTAAAYHFECPDFFPLEDKYVLLTTHAPQTFWRVGSYTDHRFEMERFGVMDGGGFCSAKTLIDDRGRRIAWGFLWPGWGWIREPIPEAEQAGFSGVLSLPRELTILPDGGLGLEPVPELEALRGDHWRFEQLELHGDDEAEIVLLDGVEGDALEMIVRFTPSTARVFGAIVRCSPDLDELTEITYDRDAQRLGGAPLELADEEELILRIYLDRSVIEAFANGRACQTLRVLTERDDRVRVGLLARGGVANVASVDVWKMKPTRKQGRRSGCLSR